MSKLKHSYVLGFMFDHLKESKKVLLIEKLKPSWQAGLLNGVGGKVEEGESAIDAMVREFQEEASIKTSPDDWVFFGVLEGPDFEVSLFKSVGDIKTANQATAERLVISDIRDPSLPDRTISNLMTLLYCAVDPDSPKIRLRYRLD